MFDVMVSRFLYVLCWRNKVVIILLILSASLGMLITLSYHSSKHPAAPDEVLHSGKGHLPLEHHFKGFRTRPDEGANQRGAYGQGLDAGGNSAQLVQRRFLEKNMTPPPKLPLQGVNPPPGRDAARDAGNSLQDSPGARTPPVPRAKLYLTGGVVTQNGSVPSVRVEESELNETRFGRKGVHDQTTDILKLNNVNNLLGQVPPTLPRDAERKDWGSARENMTAGGGQRKGVGHNYKGIEKSFEVLVHKKKVIVSRNEKFQPEASKIDTGSVPQKEKLRDNNMKSKLSHIKQYDEQQQTKEESYKHDKASDPKAVNLRKKTLLQRETPSPSHSVVKHVENKHQIKDEKQSSSVHLKIIPGLPAGQKQNLNGEPEKKMPPRQDEVAQEHGQLQEKYKIVNMQNKRQQQLIEHQLQVINQQQKLIDQQHLLQQRQPRVEGYEPARREVNMYQDSQGKAGPAGILPPSSLDRKLKMRQPAPYQMVGGKADKENEDHLHWVVTVNKAPENISPPSTQSLGQGNPDQIKMPMQTVWQPKVNNPPLSVPVDSRTIPPSFQSRGQANRDQTVFNHAQQPFANSPPAVSVKFAPGPQQAANSYPLFTRPHLGNGSAVMPVNFSNLLLALARQRRPHIALKPLHRSTLYRLKDSWPETFAQWMSTEEVYCGGHFVAVNNEYALLKDVIIDRNFCHGRNGGEEIQEVINQPEDEEYYTYFPGFFQMQCAVKPQYFFNNNNHLNQWLYSLNSVPGDSPYSEVRPEFTIAVVRYEYANMYHTTTDFYNAFLLMEYYNKTQTETNILFVDGHPSGALDTVWEMLFNSTRRLSQQSMRTKQAHLVWSILGYNSPMMDHYAPTIPLVEEFRTFFMSSYHINPEGRKLDCDKINILFIWRRDYIAHPRNPTGSISRKIQNEQELVVTLRQNFPAFSVKGVQIDLFEMDQQLKFIAETDVLIGMHGAGLTHAMFLPKHAGLIELLPTYWSAANEHFHAIARWRRLHYRQWTNDNPENEAPNHYTKIPPEVLNGLVTDMVKVVCGLATDPPEVFLQK